jgi:hypothetical protein
MAQAAKQNTTKPIDMDFVARTVMAMADSVLINDKEQILTAAEGLANECGIELPDFGFAA